MLSGFGVKGFPGLPYPLSPLSLRGFKGEGEVLPGKDSMRGYASQALPLGREYKREMEEKIPLSPPLQKGEIGVIIE